ncbi:ABC transporter substrate-binding protein [Accumulibacter sp.]|uniref:ABC transporter substrate-binding protein n=1 Tax=Accumulibacter sp. TaxID=2053492 RepID=UPI0025FE5BE2|nr:ABC transporter substrate-binding protein [Accumulibacter sp.]MCM8624389.1 ABC transporter substrate-binding protein [Accumulibacter sp.]
MLERLNVGAIDFRHVGQLPPIFAQATGANFAHLGHGEPAPRAQALIVPGNPPIGAVADPKDKKVALKRGSNVHDLMVRLIGKHGLSHSDVQPVFVPPAEARPAFERGSVDACVIWDPFTAAAQQETGARGIADRTGMVNNDAFFLGKRNLASQRPEVITDLFDVLQQTGQR